MKFAKPILTAALLASLTLGVTSLHAADKAKVKPYPLTTCITDGEKLGSMGAPYVLTHGGREIKLCCQGCEGEFKKNAAKYLKQLDEAEKKQKK
jgi:hypothetical protein